MEHVYHVIDFGCGQLVSCTVLCLSHFPVGTIARKTTLPLVLYLQHHPQCHVGDTQRLFVEWMSERNQCMLNLRAIRWRGKDPYYSGCEGFPGKRLAVHGVESTRVFPSFPSWALRVLLHFLALWHWPLANEIYMKVMCAISMSRLVMASAPPLSSLFPSL